MDYLQEVTSKFQLAVAAGPTPEGSFKINIKDAGVIVFFGSVVTNEDAAADSTVTISRKDFENLMSGKLKAPVAFMQGKIKIQGDPTAPLKWLPVLQRSPN